MLLAATLMTLALVKANMISLRVGGVSMVAAETQAAAELQLSSFFSLNPTSTADQKYYDHWSRCSVAADNPLVDKTIFDCRPRVTPDVTVTTMLQPVGSYRPPVSENPSDFNICFNYFNAMSVASNSNFGSRAEYGAGISILTPQPRDLLTGCR